MATPPSSIETQTGTPCLAFDVHLHCWATPAPLAAAARADFGAHRRTCQEDVADPELRLTKTVEQMDQNQVRLGLVSGGNEEALRWVDAFPQRFLASFRPDMSLDAQRHLAAAELFERDVEQRKWRALGEIGLPYGGRPLNDPTLFPYYDVCQRRGIPAGFHCGFNGPDPQRLVTPRFRVELGDPLLLQDVIVRYPDLKILIMHMGWPFFDHALYMLYAYPNVYLDTATVNWILGPSLFKRMLLEAVETVGSDRILFGSDQMVWPQMITPATQAIAAADYLSEADKRRILWDNAAALFRVAAPRDPTG